MLDKKFGSRWRVQKVAAHQSRAEVDSGCLSHHAWSGNSKADEMARSGATRYAVAPGDVYAHGAAWDKATDLAQFLTGAALYICSSGEWSADTKSADELEFCDVVPAVLGSRSRFTKLRGLLIAGDVLDANEMLATSSRWRHSKGRLVYRCMVLREGMLLLFRECTGPTGFDVLDRSRGAPCVVPAAQTAALRCVNVAPEHDPLTQGASDCVSWSLAVTRLRECGCWMMQLSPCRVLCKALMFVCWH